MKKLTALLLCLCAILLTGCSEKDPYADIPYPTVTITMKSGEVMKLELYPAAAPNTVANFINLCDEGFYDGLKFHRVVAGYMIQGGDPNGNGTGDAGFTIQGEFADNGITNPISHSRGVISMSRYDQEMDSASCQFFILQYDYPELDGKYAAFGRLLDSESLKVLDTMATTSVDAYYAPLFDLTIDSITVDTHGYDYTASRIEND